jgi:hypothetical protein
MTFAEQTQDVEIVRAVEVNFGGDLPISRRRLAQWNNEVELALRGRNGRLCPRHSIAHIYSAIPDGFPDIQSYSVFFDAPPAFELNGPVDSDSIARFRQHYQSTFRKRQDYTATSEQKGATYPNSIRLSLEHQFICTNKTFSLWVLACCPYFETALFQWWNLSLPFGRISASPTLTVVAWRKWNARKQKWKQKTSDSLLNSGRPRSVWKRRCCVGHFDVRSFFSAN